MCKHKNFMNIPSIYGYSFLNFNKIKKSIYTKMFTFSVKQKQAMHVKCYILLQFKI